jgi:hypothetical protein
MTTFGEFSALGQLSTLDSFFRSCPDLEKRFSQKMIGIKFYEICVGLNCVRFFSQNRLVNLGSMLCSQFSAIFDNFWQKNGVFLKNQCYDQNFCKN